MHICALLRNAPNTIVAVGWDYTSTEFRPLTGPLFLTQMMHEGIWSSDGMILDICKENPKDAEKILFPCHSIHHKSHMDWPGREPGPVRWEAGDQPPELWQGLSAPKFPRVNSKQGVADTMN
jgi:hypothetical protein